MLISLTSMAWAPIISAGPSVGPGDGNRSAWGEASVYIGRGEVHMLSKTMGSLWDGESLQLYNMTNSSLVDEVACPAPGILMDSDVVDIHVNVPVSRTGQTIMCGDATIDWAPDGLTVNRTGDFYLGDDADTSTRAFLTDVADCNAATRSNDTVGATMVLLCGGSLDGTDVSLSDVRDDLGPSAFATVVSPDQNVVMIVFPRAENDHTIADSVGIDTSTGLEVEGLSNLGEACVASTSGGGPGIPGQRSDTVTLSAVGIDRDSVWAIHTVNQRKGATQTVRHVCIDVIQLESASKRHFEIPVTSVSVSRIRAECSVIYDGNVFLNGTSISNLENFDSADCLDPNHLIISSNGRFQAYWPDTDGDGVNNLEDAFPDDREQSKDADGDGFGDDSNAPGGDSCPNAYGTSTAKPMLGCVDSDGDGYANEMDRFPIDETQWTDTDGDGYGDNPDGNQSDACPGQPGLSRRDRLGCPDTDLDGWSDGNDDFPSNPTQWRDTDRDGYGDLQIEGAFQPDSCPNTPGNSTIDVFGCIDTDGDGVSDRSDDFPEDHRYSSDEDGDGVADEVDEYPYEPTQHIDSDGDTYGDNQSGRNGDAFPQDPTQWSDLDGDGYGDNPAGTDPDTFPSDPFQWQDTDGDMYGDNKEAFNGDRFPDDHTQWSDIDGDGRGDNYVFVLNITSGLREQQMGDAFPFDFSQWNDTDGDGYGDEPYGRDGDAFPLNRAQWMDSDGDGLGDNLSAGASERDVCMLKTDPPEVGDCTDDRDNDGRGDLADPFPGDSTQWMDADGDGMGDNQSGNNPDPSLMDQDNDFCPDPVNPDEPEEGEDLFPLDPRECFDHDGDGIGDNADSDDDNDGYSDEEEFRVGTSQFNAAQMPIEPFEVRLTDKIVLGAWDMVAMLFGVPMSFVVVFSLLTRNERTRRFEEQLEDARNEEELEETSQNYEQALLYRLIGPHQALRLERVRSKLENTLQSRSAGIQEQDWSEMGVESDRRPTLDRPDADIAGVIGDDGYEWLEHPEGSDNQWFRIPESGEDWQPWEL